MKSPSLDVLYTSLNKHILLAQSYSEIPELYFIIKSCRLKPYDFLIKKNYKTILYRLWVDEFNNSLQLKGKKLSIIYNDLLLDGSKIICTDLYYGLSIKKIIKMSKLIYLCAGFDEDKQEETFFLTLLGLDNYLRSYLYLYGEWQQVSSLLLGLSHLKILSRHTDIQYFRNLPKKENYPLPCLSAREWLSVIPTSQSFLDEVKKQHETLLPLFGD